MVNIGISLLKIGYSTTFLSLRIEVTTGNIKCKEMYLHNETLAKIFLSIINELHVCLVNERRKIMTFSSLFMMVSMVK